MLWTNLPDLTGGAGYYADANHPLVTCAVSHIWGKLCGPNSVSTSTAKYLDLSNLVNGMENKNQNLNTFA